MLCKVRPSGRQRHHELVLCLRVAGMTIFRRTCCRFCRSFLCLVALLPPADAASVAELMVEADLLGTDALLALNVTGIPFLGLMGSVGAAAVAIAVLIAITLTPVLNQLISD
jgi:hypothetical protein